jgi:hypothetical protein
MQPNPYESPRAPDSGPRVSWARERLQKVTLVEWLVILAVIVVIVALFLPDVDETSTEVQRKYGKTRPPAGNARVESSSMLE